MRSELEDNPKLSGTEFLSKDYRTFDASELPDGTVVNISVWAFFKPDNPDIIGLFETKDEADAHAKYCRAMTVVEYRSKENENK